MKLYPSLIAAPAMDLANAIRQTEQTHPVTGWHLDVMDGHFVPNITLGPDVAKAAKTITQKELDVHLMVQHPEQWIEPFAKAGAHTITFHIEATVHGHRLCQQIKALGIQVGVALNPGTPLVLLEPLLPFVDRVLVMAVNPGFSRQAHLPEVYPKIQALHLHKQQNQLTFDTQVDGGVHLGLWPTLEQLGVTSVVMGGALFKP